MFAFKVTDVFQVKGRGTVLVARPPFHVRLQKGDTLELRKDGNAVARAPVVGVESFVGGAPGAAGVLMPAEIQSVAEPGLEAWLIPHRPATLVIVSLLVAGLMGFSLFHFCAEPFQPKTPFQDFHYYLASTSPDGRYTCVVAEKNAPSSHTYRFAIVETKVRGIGLLPGDVLEINSDSHTLDIQKIGWDAEGVTVVENLSSHNNIARGAIREGKQYWTDCRLAPATATSSKSP